MEKKYKYDAFISYRHAELDKFVAENLHTKLESFRIPSNLKKKANLKKTRIERVFRDRDELPITNNLEDPIVAALRDSEALIVICSPRLGESTWCRKEIETFARFHGRDNIYAVLIEGEPEDSFVDELLYREETVTQPDGRMGIERKRVEPLAADIRATDRKEMLKLLDVEMLRLLAPMLGVDFDDLKQRHRERRMRKIITYVSVIAAVLFLFAAGSLFSAISLGKQKRQIEDQAARIKMQADELYEQTVELEEQNHFILEQKAISMAKESLNYYATDDRGRAIETALEALTESDGLAMPYTEDAQYALCKALHVYDNGDHIKAAWQIETHGMVDNVFCSPNGHYVAVVDKASQLYLWDINEEKQIMETDVDLYAICDGNDFFYKEELLFYSNIAGYLTRYDLLTGEEKVVCKDNAYMVKIDQDRGLVYFSSYDQLYCYNIQKDTLICAENMSGQPSIDGCIDSENGNLLIYTSDYEEYHMEYYEAETLQPISQIETSADFMEGFTVHGGKGAFAKNTHHGFGVETFLYGADFNIGTVLWETESLQDFYEDMFLSPDGNHLIAIGNSVIRIYDPDTGEKFREWDIDDSIAGYFSNDFNKFIYVATEGTSLLCLSYERDDILRMNGIFDVNCGEIKSLKRAGLLFATAKNSNRIIVYGTSMGYALTEDDETEYEDPVENALDAMESVNWAKKYKLPYPEQVKCVLLNDDETRAYVTYGNGDLDVFEIDGNNARLLQEKMDTDVMNSYSIYVGRDNYGNDYILNIGKKCALAIAPSGKPIAYIEGLRAVMGDYLVVEDANGRPYAAPIYSVEELIELAKKKDYTPE